MCSVGTPGFYTAPTDMQADQRILARVGPGTESAAIVTGVSADGRFVNLRVFPDQGEAFHIQGIGFGDDEQRGSFANLIPHEEAPEGDTASKEVGEADKRRKMTRKEKAELPEKRAEEARKKKEEEDKKDKERSETAKKKKETEDQKKENERTVKRGG